MKKLYCVIILSIGLFLVVSNDGFSNEPPSYQRIKDSLQIEHFQSQLDNQNQRIDIAIERESKFFSSIELFFVITGAMIALVGGFTTFYGFKSLHEVKKEYEKKLLDATNTLKKENEKSIDSLIINESKLRLLKEKSNLIVINPEPEGDDIYLQRILDQFNAVKLSLPFSDSKLIHSVQSNIKKDAFNIVILEDSDDRWGIGTRENPARPESIAEAVYIVKSLPENVFVLYFGPGCFPDKPFQYSMKSEDFRRIFSRIAFTNSPSKLFVNILDTLRFMDLIKPQ